MLSDRVLVLGDDVRAFLGVVRSLGRRGLEVHVAPTDTESPALASSYIATIHILPAYALGAQAWEAALRQLVTTFDYQMIIPCSDATLIQLHHHRSAIGEGRLALPNAEAFAVFTSKTRTRQVAASLSVPVAAGQGLCADDRAEPLVRRYGLPLLLKPAQSYRVGDSSDKRKVEMIRDAGTLERALSAGAWRDSLVEAYFAGEGVGVSVLAKEGRIVQTYQHRRLRQFTETGVSTSRVSETVDPDLFGHVERLAEATALGGVAMFEFKRDPITGKHVLLEVNPRFWGSLPLAIAAGADFPAMLSDQRRGIAISPRDYRLGVVKRDLGGEYERRVIKSETAGSSLARLLWSISALVTPWTLKRSEADSWAADDPAPYDAELQELATRIREALAKRLRMRSRRIENSATPPAAHLRSA